MKGLFSSFILKKTKKFQLICLIFSGFFLNSCVGTPPLRTAAVAQLAYKKAKESKALQYSSQKWLDAEAHYEKAIYYYKNKDYRRAHIFFTRAITLFEQAEEQALRVKKEREKL